MTDFAAKRARMVERQLRGRGIEDERVLAAMGAVPRERFVSRRQRHHAYDDSALPIGAEQTISQPWIVAAICQALELRGDERLLEVGTGSGYSAAVLALLAAEVIGIERHESLARGAAKALAEIDAGDVEVLVGDGSRGYPEGAPYEGIAVHATAPEPPPTLVAQLAEGGRMVVPVASVRGGDVLTLLRRRGETVEREEIAPCRFVPLIGEEGF
jgi:protein-L-isoaspartate(D-aspartate) O-methyltransferase